MAQAVAIVQAEGAVESCMALADRIGPHGSRRYGYRTIARALRAGLLALDKGHPTAAKRGAGAVVLGPNA